MAQPPKAARPELGRKAPNAIAMDEVDLVSLVAMEDVRAFEALYRAYHPRLRRFLRGMTWDSNSTTCSRATRTPTRSSSTAAASANTRSSRPSCRWRS